ncbi:MAG: cytochrome c oxidase subunit 3 [Deinococcales bacterium]
MSAPVTYEKLSARQVRMYWGGLWLLLLSEAMIFVTVFAVRFLMAQATVSPDVNKLLGGLITLIFLLSLVPARGAVREIRQGRNDLAGRSLGITNLLGILAFAGVIVDFFTAKLDPGSRFGESYFLATGYHALHIFVGIIVLSALWSSARRGRFSVNNHWSVEGGVMFWNFVVLMWVLLYVIYFWV